MPYESKAIANRFLDLARVADSPLTPMKIQKLVYYAHGWTLALRDEDLIDEQVQAWPYGPVIPTLYHCFGQYGNQPITDYAMEYNWRRAPGGGDDDHEYEAHAPRIEAGDTPEAGFANDLTARIWDVYGGFTAIQLSNMTHAPGSPWDQVSKEYGGRIPKGTMIPRATILQYFRAQLARKAATA